MSDIYCLREIVDCARDLIDDLGGIAQRQYRVIIRRRAWSGGVPGQGTATVTDLEILPRPRVRSLSPKEVAESGGTYQDNDFMIDRITPPFTATTSGGYTPARLNIRPANRGEDVAIMLIGDEGTLECQLVGKYFDHALEYKLVARNIKGPVRG